MEEAQPISNSYAISDLQSHQLDLFVSMGSINKAIEDSFRRILAQKQVVAGLDSQKSDREQQVESIFEDQQRLRENMKSLKGSAEEKALVQRYTQQLNDQETKLEQLRKEMAELDGRIAKERTALDELIGAITFDAQL